MNLQFVVIMILFSIAFSGTTVNILDKCEECQQFKSESDCKSNSKCTWNPAKEAKEALCQQTSVTKFIPYCPQITDGSICGQTFGCAFLDGKCTHFAGCSAYVKSTLIDCQTISYRCISNGDTCTDALECKDYPQQNCEITPNIQKRKCKWDTVCRDYLCTEISDSECSSFSECVNTGYGCVAAPLPNCSELKGNETTCPQMTGADGKCKFNGTNCALKLCSDFPGSSPIDSDCQAFQSFCLKSTGKGCITILNNCSSYIVTSAAIDCIGYIGTDGVCEGDPGYTFCRSRMCDNGIGTTDEECNIYKSGCVTNGVKCTNTRLKCSNYNGTITTCLNYIGLDGKCKGKSTKFSSCQLRDCELDSKITYTTDELCQSNIQKYCYTNGVGCVKILQKCDTYETECDERIGSDGKCKQGTSGKCTARLCSDAPLSINSTQDCNKYQIGCVTTGAGCIEQTLCSMTIQEKSCRNTIEQQNTCNWNSICVSNTQCSYYNTPSLCARYKMQNNGISYPCTWDGSCRRAVCKDFQFLNDTNCNNALSGCVYDGVSGCVIPICSNFKGTKITCLGFKAYCTNTEVAASNDICINRQCNDSGLTYTTDNQCQEYLSGCLTNGLGCISNTSPCSSYTGTPEQCDQFSGYNGSMQRFRCWNTVPTYSPCIEKLCQHAIGMTQNYDCDTFLIGCLFDGGSSCVPLSSSCSAYLGSSIDICFRFKGDFGSRPCWWTSGSYCTSKSCSQDTNSNNDNDCNTFLSGCVTKGTGCTDPTTFCSAYTGTAVYCNFFTFKPPSGNPVKCTRLENCTAKTCTNKTDAASNTDCLNYHNTCRSTYGSTTCQTEKTLCTGYALTGSFDAAKSAYCNSMTIQDNSTICGYKSTVPGTCSARTCDIWVNTLTSPCVDYAGTASCKLSPNGTCYAVEACTSYTPPSSVTDKIAWCNAMYDNQATPLKCTFTNVSTCVAITTCETIPSPTSAAYCNAFLRSTDCQFYYGKCYTTQVACTAYLLNDINTQSSFCHAIRGKVAPCKYDFQFTTISCVDIVCSDIQWPTSQQSCDQIISGCTYYSGACYTKTQCSTYITPQYVLTEDLKLLFCQNMFENTTTDFCTYSSGNVCSPPAYDCTAFSLLEFWPGSEAAYCQKRRNKIGRVCRYDPATTYCCVEPQDASEICTLVPGTVDNNLYCDLRTEVGKCEKKNDNTCGIRSPCTAYDFGTAITDNIKSIACQKFIGDDGFYCTWTTGANCETSKNTCADWSGLTVTSQDNTEYCEARIDKTGKKCTYSIWQAACREFFACENAIQPQSQIDCDFLSIGCTYQSGKCYVASQKCFQFKAVGIDDQDKLEYCNGLTDDYDSPCTFMKGLSSCITKGPCSVYIVVHLPDASSKYEACKQIKTFDQGCTYWPGIPQACVSVWPCTAYVGTTIWSAAEDCAAQKDPFGFICIAAQSGTACESPVNCEAIPYPGSQADCDKYLAGCFYHFQKCYTLQNCSTYTTNGYGAKSFCNSMREFTLIGPFCTASSDFDYYCTSRTCSDVSYTTHSQCQAYLSTCKSNRTNCIPQSIACTSQQGNPYLCQWLLDTDGISTCIDTFPTTVSFPCINRTCTQNVSATSDPECDSYLAGCLTDGLGCIANTEPCTSYYGTTSVCKAFTGNHVKCWGTSDTVIDACRNRVCTDNTSATTDDECQIFLSGCLTNGAGCISKSSSCSAYKGTQDICKNFMGSNQTVLCYNTSAATITTTCKKRACSDLNGTSDSDCASFIPSSTNIPNCVTNGTSCVAYPKNCTDFKGTEITCPKFTAFDGPCKNTTYTTAPAVCTPKVCSEAPNNLITDDDCKKYHPSCVTTGRGCMKKVECKDIQTQTACGIKNGCLWVNQCSSTPSSCGSLTSQGQSICFNTPLSDNSICTWSENICRSFTCVDYDASLTTHDQCNTINPTCTTSGAGCITMGICNSYKTPTICAAATTLENSKKCTWVATDTTAICRTRQCSDANFKTDDQCNTFLYGCKTSGDTCIGPNYNCSIFTEENLCVQDSTGYPCLYVNGVCYNYAECNDAYAMTLEECQKFNSLCVPTDQGVCMAQTSCEKYKVQQSCTKGINNTICGWLPTLKCQIFNSCADVISTSNTDCQNYGSECITDGKQCVEIGKCDSYQTQIACENEGNQFKCAWVASSNSCRFKQCGDKVSISDADCASWIVTTGVCTTDGTTCVARAACTTYQTEAACTIGSDGIPCIFSFPVGSTTGTKSCRVKECSDIKGAITDLCIGKISGKACVSNGNNCIKQDACGNYSNKISCEAGGTDGLCAFTSPGTCTLFTSCDKARDQHTCLKKSLACKWDSNKCQPKTCEQGSICNPIPSFDEKTYTICALINGVCTPSDPSKLTREACLTKSQYTYTWSELTQQCVSCKGGSQNNTTNINTTNITPTSFGYRVFVPLIIYIFA